MSRLGKKLAFWLIILVLFGFLAGQVVSIETEKSVFGVA